MVWPPLSYRSVMVPLDGSPFGEHALPLALEIAQRDQARLLVVHVASSLLAAHSLDHFFSSTRYVQRRQQKQEYLDSIVGRLAKVSSVPVTPILMEDESIAQSLMEMAEAGADLVVMATHGRGTLARFWRASVADILTRQLSIPVVVLRGRKESPDLTRRPAVRRVLVPLDGSCFSEQVLEPAVAWGTLTDAEYTLVHVIDPATVPDFEPADRWGNEDHQLGRLPPESTNFRRVVERLAQRELRVNALILFDAEPTHAILRFARIHGADLIALATRGRGGLSRLFRGSTADRVIRGASVPVLVFRPML